MPSIHVASSSGWDEPRMGGIVRWAHSSRRELGHRTQAERPREVGHCTQAEGPPSAFILHNIGWEKTISTFKSSIQVFHPIFKYFASSFHVLTPGTGTKKLSCKTTYVFCFLCIWDVFFFFLPTLLYCCIIRVYHRCSYRYNIPTPRAQSSWLQSFWFSDPCLLWCHTEPSNSMAIRILAASITPTNNRHVHEKWGISILPEDHDISMFPLHKLRTHSRASEWKRRYRYKQVWCIWGVLNVLTTVLIYYGSIWAISSTSTSVAISDWTRVGAPLHLPPRWRSQSSHWVRTFVMYNMCAAFFAHSCVPGDAIALVLVWWKKRGRKGS